MSSSGNSNSNDVPSLNDFVFLHLCRDDGPYKTGETIYGTITYDFNQCRNWRDWNLNSLESIELVCTGRAEICEIDEIPEGTELFLNRETCIYPTITTTRGNQSPLKIATYSFSFDLPNELPISFHNDSFEIIYKVSSFLMFKNKKCGQVGYGTGSTTRLKYTGPNIRFQVTRKINLQFNPLANSSFTLRNYKTYGRIGLIKLNWRRGTIKYKMSIDPRGFVPGDRVTFDCLIDNDTNKEIDIARVYVREVFLRDYLGTTVLLKSRELNQGRYSSSIPAFSNRFWMGGLEIPMNLTSSAINCDLLRVEHYIVIELKESTSSGKSEKLLLRGHIQIFIGDIGLENENSENRAEAEDADDPSPPTRCPSRRRRHRRLYWSRSPPKYDTIIEEFELIDNNPPPTYDEAMEFLSNNKIFNNDVDDDEDEINEEAETDTEPCPGPSNQIRIGRHEELV